MDDSEFRPKGHVATTLEGKATVISQDSWTTLSQHSQGHIATTLEGKATVISHTGIMDDSSTIHSINQSFIKYIRLTKTQSNLQAKVKTSRYSYTAA